MRYKTGRDAIARGPTQTGLALFGLVWALAFHTSMACTLEPQISTAAGPRVIETSPQHLSIDNTRNTYVHFWFDRPLDPASIGTGAIRLRSREVGQGGDISYDPLERRLSFLTSGSFRRNLAYDARLSENIRGLRLGLPIESFDLTFVTGTESETHDPDVAPSFPREIFPIFLSQCAYPGCHAGEIPAAGVDLSSPTALGSTAVGRRSREWAGWPIVDPGSAAWSYLAYKIMGEQTIRGDEMPPGGLLSTEEIASVLDWIEGGAKVDASGEGP